MNFKVLVVGDGCYDFYSYCSVAGLAPDKPIQILKLEKEVRSPGMALNVAANLSSLGVTSKTLSNENWSKIEKNRFVDIKSNHMFCRVDKTEPITRINLNLIDYDCDAIIISDYDKGFLNENDIEEICAKHPLTFLDTKKRLDDWARNATFIKINNYEYERSLDFIVKSDMRNIIQTCGSDGAKYLGEVFPVKQLDVIDVSGAGDTFLAGFVFEFLKTKKIKGSIIFANECSSKVIQHRGITVL